MTGSSATAGRPRVLLVTPSFFGYERAIADELRAQGADVTVVDERPSNASWFKAVARVAPGFVARLSGRRLARRSAQLAEQGPLDLVVVVKGELVTPDFVDTLRADHPGCVVVSYAYDSFGNSPSGRALVPVVDHAFTFDRSDAATYGLRYLPLFHTAEFAAARAGRDHDLAFVGTVHSQRWEICQRLFAAVDTHLGFFYSPARWHLALQRLLHGDVRRIPRSDVSFDKLGRSEVAEIFGRSRAVVDVQRDGQSGLTMRTFEVLAAGAGLVTTNPHVTQEPFFDPRWVMVLEGRPEEWSVERVREFVETCRPAPVELLEPYSLAAWTGTLLDLARTGTSVS